MLGPPAVFNHGGDRARLLEPSPPSIAGRPRHSKFAAQRRHTLLATHRPHHKLHPLFAHVRSLPWHRPEPPLPQTLPNSGVMHVLIQPVTDVMRPNSSAAPLQRIWDNGKAAASRRTPRKSGEELAEDVVYGLGVGLAAGGFHDLADEKFEDAFVAGFEFGDVFGVFGDDFASGLLDGGVAN